MLRRPRGLPLRNSSRIVRATIGTLTDSGCVFMASLSLSCEPAGSRFTGVNRRRAGGAQLFTEHTWTFGDYFDREAKSLDLASAGAVRTIYLVLLESVTNTSRNRRSWMVRRRGLLVRMSSRRVRMPCGLFTDLHV